MSKPTIILKRRHAKPIFMHHPWIYSQAVERVSGSPTKAGIVAVEDADGRFIGQGDFNPDSQIPTRIYSWREDETPDEEFWRGRIRSAVELRHAILKLPAQRNAYRLVYSEGDGLPGLLVDRYDNWLVMQLRTAGMASRRELLARLLREESGIKNIYEKADPESARLEAIPPVEGVVSGEEPPARIIITDGGIRLLVDVRAGQKTGFFLDQADNRRAAAAYAAGRRALDAYSYSGGFSLWAMRGGAKSALALDSSASARELAAANFAENGLTNAEARRADVNVELRALKRAGERFGLIALDPPRFARSRSGVKGAARGYHDVNLLALQLLEPGGILVSCSCSQHMTADDFLRMLNAAAVESRRTLQIIEARGQAPDHPIAANCPETAYLKCIIARAT